MWVLYLEDDAAIARAIGRRLRTLTGLRVRDARDMEAVFGALRDERELPAAILLDVHLVGNAHDGVAILAALRAAAVRTPCAFLTSEDPSKLADRLRDAGLGRPPIFSKARETDEAAAWVLDVTKDSQPR